MVCIRKEIPVKIMIHFYVAILALVFLSVFPCFAESKSVGVPEKPAITEKPKNRTVAKIPERKPKEEKQEKVKRKKKN